MKHVVLLLIFAIAVIPAASQTPPKQLSWKTFTNRAGWSIQYQVNWKIGSCNNCSDPAEGTVFVTFRNPDRPEDFVMVEHLATKPADKSPSQWLQEMSKAISNPRTSEQTLLIDGMPALKVQFRHPSGREGEAVLIIRNSDTFQIGIYDDKAGERIQDMAIYPIYQHMLSTFRFTRK